MIVPTQNGYMVMSKNYKPLSKRDITYEQAVERQKQVDEHIRKK